MFVLKKKFQELEKRIANLGKTQSQPVTINSPKSLEMMKAALKAYLCQGLESCLIEITIPK